MQSELRREPDVTEALRLSQYLASLTLGCFGNFTSAVAEAIASIGKNVDDHKHPLGRLFLMAQMQTVVVLYLDS